MATSMLSFFCVCSYGAVSQEGVISPLAVDRSMRSLGVSLMDV